MEFLKRGQIIDNDDQEYLKVEVSDWGGSVFVRGLTGEEASEFDAICDEHKDKLWKDERFWLLSKCLLDENKQQLFPGAEGIKELSKKKNMVIWKLYAIAKDLSIMGMAEAAELLSELKKAQEGDFSSACVHI